MLCAFNLTVLITNLSKANCQNFDMHAWFYSTCIMSSGKTAINMYNDEPVYSFFAYMVDARKGAAY